MKKTILKSGILFIVGILLLSCSDFEEINVNPTAANAEQVQVEYFINNSIISAQQDPHIAERVFVLYWKDAGRMDRIGTLSEGGYNDGWSSDYYRYISGWLNHANTAVKIADQKIESGNIKPYTSNLKQIARIWRAYLMSEMSDNFGSMPVDGFKGVNPNYNSVEEVYTFILTELKEAVAAIDETVESPNNDLAKLDPAYGYNYVKWKKYGNSLRMRLAMRLSEIDPGKAQSEFEDAASGSMFIGALDDNFAVQEEPGWNALTGVMSREWNMQYLSATLNNLMIDLGGVKSADQLPTDLHSHIKPDNYMGLKFENHFTTLTNDPSAGYWFDGLHDKIDPRAYELFIIPGWFDNPEFNRYPSWSSGTYSNTKRALLDEEGDTILLKEAAFTWNAHTIGDWGEKGAKNRLIYPATTPRLANKYRNSSMERIFFASWESYFLIAEAAVRNWNVPMDAQTAYERGIEESFAYIGVSEYLSDYLTSEDYNRAGTSVSWSHTTEPPATKPMTFINGYNNIPGVSSMKYPENSIYENGAVKNDYLNKIITQKYIAQTPWLPLEAWSDHRRLGLPFFENPAIENPIDNLPNLTTSNYMTNDVSFFPQRLKYPSSLENNVPIGYQEAVQALGGPDEILTPLWWAQKN